MKLKKFLYCSVILLIQVGCTPSKPSIKSSTDNFVTIEHVYMGMIPTVTPEMRELAEKHCNKSGRSSVYTKTVRDSGFGPEEHDFKCVGNNSLNQQVVSPKKLETKNEIVRNISLTETIVIPVSSMGDVSDTRKQILENTLTDELKKHFRIVPQEKYEQVLEQVFEELEYEECSEDQCIMRIQEILQVENVFNLQIIGEGKDSQLNLKWITLDEKKNEEDYCRSCGTYELREMIGGLVEKLVGGKSVELVVKKKPIVVVEKKEKGVLYKRKIEMYGKKVWIKKRTSCDDNDICLQYQGEIVDGVPNGQGRLSWGDGLYYEGEIVDGVSNGQGTATNYDGSKILGEFKDGSIWNGTQYDKDGNILYKLVNGVRQ
jgi:hypothetical protein